MLRTDPSRGKAKTTFHPQKSLSEVCRIGQCRLVIHRPGNIVSGISRGTGAVAIMRTRIGYPGGRAPRGIRPGYKARSEHARSNLKRNLEFAAAPPFTSVGTGRRP